MRLQHDSEHGMGTYSTVGSQAVAGRYHGRLWVSLAVFLPVLIGCGTTELQDEYGKRNGPMVFASVNGTAVFAEMCEARGHTVFSWPALSPRIQQRADCIVWFPDDYEPPEREVQRWLERWLKAKPNRTVIYVGRHFDSVAWYWEHVEDGALPAALLGEIRRRRKEARREFGQSLKPLAKSTDHDWFTLEGPYLRRKITTLDGEADWLQGIDPTKTSMEVNARMVPPTDADVLLASEGDAIVFRQRVRQSQLLVVANGSFLLNAPLSLHEHRRLAGKLIDEIGPAEKTIAFLEFDPYRPKIADKDPSFGPRLGFEVFHVWPTNWILLHVVFLGILYCYWRFPIFGQPVDPRSDSTSDFGLHIDAVAKLLARTGNTTYAHARLQHHRQTTRVETTPLKTPTVVRVPTPDVQQPLDEQEESDTSAESGE